MKRVLLLTLFLLSAFIIKSQIPTVCFSDPVHQIVGSGPYDLTSADFNNDGKPDIAVACSGMDTLSVLINSGNGTFTTTLNYVVGLNPWRVISSDFNSDGNMDLVTVNGVNGGSYWSVSVLLGSGTGTFAAAVNYSVGPTPTSISTGDFNNDGKIDLAVGGIIDTYFLYGIGNGSFAQGTTFGQGWESMSSISGDFNKDGVSDLAFIDSSTGSVMSIYFGGLGLTIQNYAVGINVWSITSGDFNSDGNLDLAACSADFVSILLGFGTGVFNTPVTYTLSTIGAVGITSADFNSDGNIDLAIADSGGPDEICLLLGSANGTFSLSPLKYTLGAGTVPVGVISSDFNGDGKFDLATSNLFTSNVSILLNNIKPSLVISGSNSICIGSNISLSVSGAASYSWSTGDTTNAITFTSTGTSSYSVIGTGINYCYNTQTISVLVENTCQDVWSGDANSDGRADNLDILELGLHYTQTGAPRTTISNTWQSYVANNWPTTITNGKNLNHSDCNGDGIIDDNDTLAIYNNYSLSHAFKPIQTNTVSAQLSIVPDQIAVAKGMWGSASIYLGDNANSINNINGVAFTVDFDNTLIEPNSIYIEYQNSFLDVANQNLDFRKLNFSIGKIYTATTHTITANVSGFGKIATLHYQIKANLNTDEVLNIGLLDANLSDASGTIIPLTSGTSTLIAMGSSVGINKISENSFFTISPNPSNGRFLVSSLHSFEKLEVCSVTGQVVLSVQVNDNQSHLNLENMSNGIYFLKVYKDNKQISMLKLIVQQ